MLTILIALALLVWLVAAIAGVALCRAAAKGDANMRPPRRSPDDPDARFRPGRRERARRRV
jgi:multisubunit Na+/H+ antiporter MnhG subunit